jgi:hypothetical protein
LALFNLTGCDYHEHVEPHFGLFVGAVFDTKVDQVFRP